MKYDLFICHASVDKEPFVDSLVAELKKYRLQIWYDEFAIRVGDSIRSKIDYGVRNSRYGVIVFSPAFLRVRKWTEYELDGLFQRESIGEKVALPIWYNITSSELEAYSPSLAMRYALDASNGLGHVVDGILDVLGYKEAAFVGNNASSLNWIWKASPTTAKLYDIVFLDNRQGWIVGERGTILETSNSGCTWNLHDSFSSQSFNTIAFSADKMRGCIASRNGSFFETVDGGRSWIPSVLNMDVCICAGVMCNSGEDICLVGNEGLVLRGTPGSNNWRRQRISTTACLWAVDFSEDGRVGCIVGDTGTVLLSLDAGHTWIDVDSGLRDDLYATAVFNRGRTIFVAGDSGRVCSSQDGGLTWIQDTSIREAITGSWDNWINDCEFADSDCTGVMVGTEGLILETIDHGKSWVVARLEDRHELEAVRYIDKDHVWCVGSNGTILVANCPSHTPD